MLGPLGRVLQPIRDLAPSGTFTADVSSPGITIPADFVGLSWETGSTGLLSNYFTGSSASLAGLIGMLGTNGSLRFGGGTSDLATPAAVTQTHIDNLNSFLGLIGAGWNIIFGLSVTANDSATAATQSAMVNSTIGASKTIFQFGNEPGQGASPNYSIPTYESRWNAYYSAVIAAAPTARFAAIDGSDFLNMPTIVGTLTPGASGMALLTQHYYPWGNPPGVPASGYSNLYFPALNSSFLNTPCKTFDDLFALNAAFAAAHSVKMRMTETNMISGGGQSGITDRQINALYIFNLAIRMAKAGWAGFNLHADNGGASYSPLVLSGSDWSPRPNFYALYMLARLNGCRIVPCPTPPGAPNSITLAVLGANGNAILLIVNLDTVQTLWAQPEQSAAWSTADTLLLSCTGPLDTAPTLGGAAIGAGGVWTGVPTTIARGQSIAVPPCGAVLVTIKP